MSNRRFRTPAKGTGMNNPAQPQHHNVQLPHEQPGKEHQAPKVETPTVADPKKEKQTIIQRLREQSKAVMQQYNTAKTSEDKEKLKLISQAYLFAKAKVLDGSALALETAKSLVNYMTGILKSVGAPIIAAYEWVKEWLLGVKKEAKVEQTEAQPA